jgi:zinc transporter ZupT
MTGSKGADKLLTCTQHALPGDPQGVWLFVFAITLHNVPEGLRADDAVRHGAGMIARV